MAQNMGATDVRVRRLAAVVMLAAVAVLAFLVQGVAAFVVAGILAAFAVVFLVTAQVRTCPLYMPFHFSTKH